MFLRRGTRSTMTGAMTSTSRNVLSFLVTPSVGGEYPYNVNVSVLSADQVALVQRVQTAYSVQMSGRNYASIPRDYTQFVELMGSLSEINVNDSSLKLLIRIVQDALQGASNLTLLYENVIYNEIQILTLERRITEILSDKNVKRVIGDCIRGDLTTVRHFKLSPILSYYVHLYGVPAFGVGFDGDKLRFLANIVGLGIVLPKTPAVITAFDPAQALTLLMDVRELNTRLGIVKDELNHQVLRTTYNPNEDRHVLDAIAIDAENFFQLVAVDPSGTSVGAFVDLPLDFQAFVSAFAKSFPPLAPLFPPGYAFDASATTLLFTPTPRIQGGGLFTNSQSGKLVLDNVAAKLRAAVETNPFQNRSRSALEGTASYELDETHYGVRDGFIAGDRIHLDKGLSITVGLRYLDPSANTLSNVVLSKTYGPVPILLRLVDRPLAKFSEPTPFKGDYIAPFAPFVV
jgi:hypothetical protein